MPSGISSSLACVEEDKEQEICQQIVSLCNLRAKRNLLLPVFRLPPETLAIIFIHGARSYYESDDGGCRTIHPPSWVNVSYVCSHWRNVTLNCPTLWTYHFNTSLRWTEELLLRSKQASLKIRIHPYRCIYLPTEEVSWYSDLLNGLLKHFNRVQEFHSNISPLSLPKELSLWAPRLEKLEISLRLANPKRSIVIIGGTDLFHELRLTNCSIPWYSLHLSGLRILSLCHVHPPSPPNIVEFLTLLNNMPNLTVLHLEKSLPSARGVLSGDHLDDSLKVYLPRLALFAVIAPLSTVVALLSCVNFPLETRLSLEPQFERGSLLSEYAPISLFLTQRFAASEEASSSPPIFRSLAIDDGDVGGLTFSSLERDRDTSTPLSETLGLNIPLKIIFGEETERMSQSDRHRIISDICCSLPLNSVEALHVIKPKLLSATWKEIFGHLDALRYMYLTGGNMPNLFMLFDPPHELTENSDGQSCHDQDPTPDRMLAPALEELTLDNISFMSDGKDNDQCWSEKRLLDAVSTRKGTRDRLTIFRC